MENFVALGLSQTLVDAVATMGYVEPTPIQIKTIPLLLEKPTDLVGLAQTGTGKTAAFGLPLLDLVDATEPHTQALILAPTRELCLQITNDLIQFATEIKKLRIQPVYGGADIQRQIREIRKGAHIIVATPGRLRDLIRRKAVNIREVEFVILDEADEMLNMGFKEEIDDILSNTPDDKLTWLFSATMPKEVRQIAKTYMDNPSEISIGERNIGNTDIDHQYVVVRSSEKYDALCRFLDYHPDSFGLVFCRTRRDSKQLADDLSKDGYNADALHGDLSQSQRDRVMSRFRAHQLQVLVATDVAARGIDVQDITHVFHFNIPDDLPFYTHRSGRTARAGKKGISLVFAKSKDLSILRHMERRLKIHFTETQIPSGKDICENQLLSYIRQLREVPLKKELDAFLPSLIAELEGLSKEDLVKRIASHSFNRFFERYHNAPDLNEKPKRHSGATMHKLYINMGRMDVENKGQFISFICKTASISGSAIGKIDMQRTHSYFEVEEQLANQVKKSFRNVIHGDRELRVNDGEGKAKGPKKKKEKKWKKKKGKAQFRRWGF